MLWTHKVSASRKQVFSFQKVPEKGLSGPGLLISRQRYTMCACGAHRSTRIRRRAKQKQCSTLADKPIPGTKRKAGHFNAVEFLYTAKFTPHRGAVKALHLAVRHSGLLVGSS
jgi:hypothetical protein